MEAKDMENKNCYNIKLIQMADNFKFLKKNYNFKIRLFFFLKKVMNTNLGLLVGKNFVLRLYN